MQQKSARSCLVTLIVVNCMEAERELVEPLNRYVLLFLLLMRSYGVLRAVIRVKMHVQ
jgi:hypothetical protein